MFASAAELAGDHLGGDQQAEIVKVRFTKHQPTNFFAS